MLYKKWWYKTKEIELLLLDNKARIYYSNLNRRYKIQKIYKRYMVYTGKYKVIPINSWKKEIIDDYEYIIKGW